jgi:hypothetical protein
MSQRKALDTKDPGKMSRDEFQQEVLRLLEELREAVANIHTMQRESGREVMFVPRPAPQCHAPRDLSIAGARFTTTKRDYYPPSPPVSGRQFTQPRRKSRISRSIY